MKTSSHPIRTTLLALATLSLASTAFADPIHQTHMDKAIAYLEAAKAELHIAQPGKGGWKVPAIKSIDDAIVAVKNGKVVAADRARR